MQDTKSHTHGPSAIWQVLREQQWLQSAAIICCGGGQIVIGVSKDSVAFISRDKPSTLLGIFFDAVVIT
jgi:hypothetical protein